MENENSEIRTHIGLRDRIRHWRLQPRLSVQTSVDASALEIFAFGIISPWLWIPILVALNSMIIGVAAYWGFGFFGGFGALIAILIVESPVFYKVIQEIRREDKMLPRSEAWEKNTQWKQNLTEYCDMINKNREEKN